MDTVDEDSLALTCRLIESKLKSFGIDAAVVAARPGPVITQFEIQPGEGVKDPVSRMSVMILAGPSVSAISVS